MTVNKLHRITPKDLNNRKVIDGMHLTRSYFPDRKLDLPLNLSIKLSFITNTQKPLDFANVLHEICHYKRIEWLSNYRLDEFNHIQS